MTKIQLKTGKHFLFQNLLENFKNLKEVSASYSRPFERKFQCCKI